MNNLSLFILGLVLIYIPACLSQNNDKQCFSQALTPSYPCCKGDKVVYTDKDGEWGVEDGKWCGIGNGPSKDSDDSCFSVALGYKCCEKCNVVYTDDDGKWGVENNKWCGVKDSCFTPEPIQDDSEFDFTFLKMENNKKNMLYSPLSIKYALKMLQEGAADKTLAEINEVLGNSTVTKYESINDKLSLANGLFIKNTFIECVSEAYINTLKEKYEAEVIEDEFASADNANQWIEDKTLGIIKDMLSDETVKDALMLIINALSIDLEWINQFSESSTRRNIFYKDSGEKMDATTMVKRIYNEHLSYYIDEDITAITMDLKENNGTQLEFMAIMPNENLSGYIENVTKEQINEIDKKLELASNVNDGVILYIPKFKFSYDLELKEDLKKLGIQEAFIPKKANFSNMADLKNVNGFLYVSDALHKADIEFTEKGAKAAAATVIVMGGNVAVAPRPEFPVIIEFNKPFMFIIRDKNAKDIWFTGTIYEPNSWDNEKEYYKNLQ